MNELPVLSPAAVSVFTRILTHGPIARVSLAQATGLSQAAVTKAVAPLINTGYVEEQPVSQLNLRAGRPVSPLAVARERTHTIGIKMTFNRVFGVLVNLGGEILARTELDLVTSDEDAAVAIISQVVESLKDQRPGAAIAGVGVAVSGDIDSRRGVVRDSPLMGWRNVALRERLMACLDVSVIVENDVRALTIAEQVFGIGCDAQSFAVVTIGTGIGCGLFVNGQVIEGARGVSGEIGHLPLAPGNLVCTCGRRGCVETVASSAAILARIRSGTGRPNLTLDEAVDLAHNGSVIARDAFFEAGGVIGAALAALVNLVGPQLVIIAGDGVGGYDLYEERIREVFTEHAFGAAVECEIVVRSHAFDDWARGAAVTVIRAITRGNLK